MEATSGDNSGLWLRAGAIFAWLPPPAVVLTIPVEYR